MQDNYKNVSQPTLGKSTFTILLSGLRAYQMNYKIY